MEGKTSQQPSVITASAFRGKVIRKSLGSMVATVWWPRKHFFKISVVLYFLLVFSQDISLKALVGYHSVVEKSHIWFSTG